MNEEQGHDVCSTCGGDRRISNSFGLTTTCPSCHGSGRRAESTGFHDVTKTKPSHYKPSNRMGEAVVKPQWPTTLEGTRLATEVRDCKTVSDADKARLTREIIEYEQTHGQCTQTFLKKIRKLVRPRP
ncbi:MAG TPA: molecular chaperone DnaJ [Polyangiaceae bacterium]|jgi:hypothetical protein